MYWTPTNNAGDLHDEPAELHPEKASVNSVSFYEKAFCVKGPTWRTPADSVGTFARTTLLSALFEGALWRRCMLESDCLSGAANSVAISRIRAQNAVAGTRLLALCADGTSCRRRTSALRELPCGAYAACHFNTRSGSYGSPLTHSRCRSTASFRATATAARFFAFLPPRAAIFIPCRLRSQSGPNGPRM